MLTISEQVSILKRCERFCVERWFVCWGEGLFYVTQRLVFIELKLLNYEVEYPSIARTPGILMSWLKKMKNKIKKN